MDDAALAGELPSGQQAIADTFFPLKLLPRTLNLLDAAPLNL